MSTAPSPENPDVLHPHELAERMALADERMLLGIALQDTDKALDILAMVPASDVFHPPHAELLKLLGERISKGKSLEYTEVCVAVADRPKLFGGMGYVSSLPEYAPSTAISLEPIATRIRQRAVRRMLGAIGAMLQRAANGDPVSLEGDALPDHPDALAAAVALHLSKLAQPTVRVEWTLCQALEEAVILRTDAQLSERPPVVATEIEELDTLLDGGLRPGELVVIAGRPGSGKTAAALGLVADAAEKGARVGFISLEMSAHELSDRMLARAAGCSLSSVRRGEVDEDPAVVEWRNYLGTWPVRIAAPSSLTPEGLVTWARRWASRGLDMLVIDYLQLVKHSRAERHDLAVGSTATLCKQLARDLRIPVVLLAQLNRELEKRATPKRKDKTGAWWEEIELPRPSDLRDSGQIEQDADVIMFPLQASQFGLNMDDAAVMVIAKNRNGRVGVAPMRWDGPTASYSGRAPKKDLL